MKLKQIRNEVVAALHAHMNIPVIPDYEDAQIPPYPYITYSNTNSHNLIGQDTITYEENEDGLNMVYDNQNEPSFSFTFYSNVMDEANDGCEKMRQFFSRLGRAALSGKGIVVVEVSSGQNRSVVMIDHYVRRWGLDVRFRYNDRSSQTIQTMAAAKIENTGG